jgi:hypothetical protein
LKLCPQALNNKVKKMRDANLFKKPNLLFNR